MEASAEKSYLAHVAAHVRRRREKLGLTQESFAEHADIDPRHLRFIEAGKRDLAVSTLVRLAAALKCAPADLLKPTRPLVRKPGRPKKRPVKSKS